MEFAPASSDEARRVELAFMRYLMEDGELTGDLFAATPRDVVGFLLSCDESGRTKVHIPLCVYWGVAPMPAGASCACPTRAAADSLDTKRGRLRAVFRDKGRPGPWCPSTGTGNPCAAPEVDLLLLMSQREQRDAGCKAKQAALVDSGAFLHLQQVVWNGWSLYSKMGQYVAAATAAQDALFYSILWGSGLRPTEATRVAGAHVTLFDLAVAEASPCAPVAPDRQRGWYLHVGVTKTSERAGSSKPSRRLTIYDDGSLASPAVALLRCQESLSHVGLDLGRGHWFRPLVTAEDGSVSFGERLEYADLRPRFESWASLAGFPVAVSLHSFHGSRAARERAQGIPAEDTCREMGDWSMDMYEHYTGGRSALTIASLHLPSAMPVSVMDSEAALPASGSTVTQRMPVEAVAVPVIVPSEAPAPGVLPGPAASRPKGIWLGDKRP